VNDRVVAPFWESSYSEPSQQTFGPPAEGVLRLTTRMSPGAVVLDLGCGDGRNALALAERGFDVEALDISEAGVAKLEALAAERGLSLEARVEDVTSFRFPRAYDLIVAHGVLHLLAREQWEAVLDRMKRSTAPGGWNVVVVFTDRLPPPLDLAPHVKGAFREGELAERYRGRGWTVELDARYTLRDEHPGGVRHVHPVNEIVARRSPESVPE
jgi:tellurite methyltransferase